jgi:hypothetical protein
MVDLKLYFIIFLFIFYGVIMSYDPGLTGKLELTQNLQLFF